MNIEYEIIKLKNENIDITAIVNEPGGEMLSAFLYSDVRVFGDLIKQDLEDVLHKRKKYSDISCNACRLRITENETTIYNLYAEDEEEYYNTRFRIETAELKQVIDKWINVIKEIKPAPKKL